MVSGGGREMGAGPTVGLVFKCRQNPRIRFDMRQKVGPTLLFNIEERLLGQRGPLQGSGSAGRRAVPDATFLLFFTTSMTFRL